MKAAELSRLLADHVDQLAAEFLGGGHREGREWRAGSVAGEAGASLQLHLVGNRRGQWCDYATDQYGDMLDLISAALDLGVVDAMAWARRWLGIEEGQAVIPKRPTPASVQNEPDDPDRWRHVWLKAVPIAGTLAETYFAARGLTFADPHGTVLRFHPCCARRKQGSEDLERLPAMLAHLRDTRTGRSTGILRTFLKSDGSDRLRDGRPRLVTGKVAGSAVMLSGFDDVTFGLGITEGVETGIAVLQGGWAPIWAMTGRGNLAQLPVLGGVEALTIFADCGEPGERAAEDVAERWRAAGREAQIVAPPTGDWCDEAAP